MLRKKIIFPVFVKLPKNENQPTIDNKNKDKNSNSQAQNISQNQNPSDSEDEPQKPPWMQDSNLGKKGIFKSFSSNVDQTTPQALERVAFVQILFYLCADFLRKFFDSLCLFKFFVKKKPQIMKKGHL